MKLSVTFFDRHPIWKKRIAIFLIGPWLVASSALVALGSHEVGLPSVELGAAQTSASVDAGGSPAVYQFQVTNNAEGGDIVLSFSPCSTSGFECALTDVSGTVLTTTPGDPVSVHFPSHEVTTFLLVVTATSSAGFGTVDVTTVTAQKAKDPTLSDSQDFITTVNLGAAIDLTKSVDTASAEVGDQVMFTIEYSNGNTQTASSVFITDTVDPVFQSITTTGSISGNTITWVLGDLAPGETGVVTFTATVGIATDGQVIPNFASSGGANVQQGQSNSVFVTVSAPVLSVTKSVSTSNARQGDTLSYSVTVTNSGSDTLSGFTVSDDVDVNLTVQSIGQGGTLAGSQITWSLADLASGSSRVVTFTASVNNTAPDGSVITNAATADGNEVNPTQSNQVSTTIDSRTDLSLAKMSLSDPVVAGSDFTYRFTVTNSGVAAAQDVQVLDSLPPGVSFVSSLMCIDTGTGTFRCDLGVVGSMSSQTFDVIVHVASSVPAGTVLVNTAEVTTTNQDSNPSNNSATENTLVIEQTELTIAKSDGVSSVTAGDGVVHVYTVTVTNLGPSDATSITLLDEWPENAFTRTSLPPECTDIGSGDFTCLISSLTAGTSSMLSFDYVVDPSVTPGTYTNRVSITSLHPGDSSSGNTAQDDTEVVPAADVAVFKTAAATVRPGGLLTYFVTITSTGPSNALDVVFTDQLDLRTVFVSVSNGSCTETSGSVECDLGTMVPGQSVSFEIVVRVDKVADQTVLANSAEVSSVTTDLQLGNNSAVATTTVAGPVISLIKSASPPSGQSVSPGAPITYTITFTNSGTGDALNFTVTDTVDPLLGVQQINDGGVFDAVTRVITWTVGLVPPGATGDVSFIAAPGVVVSPVTVANRALAISDELLASVSSNLTQHQVVIPRLGITKQSDLVENQEVVAFQVVTYRLIIVNRVDSEIFGVVVTESPPAHMSYIPGSTKVDGVTVPDGGSSWFQAGLCLSPGAGGVCDGPMAANSTRVVTFQMSVNPTAPAGAVLQNWGYVSAIGHARVGDFFDLRVLMPLRGPSLSQTVLVQSASGETIFITVFNQVIAILPVTGGDLVLLVLLGLGSLGAGRNLARQQRPMFDRRNKE